MKKFVISLLLLVVLAVPAFCQETVQPLFMFVQVSDAHIIADSPVALIEKGIESINCLEPMPKFVVVTGDLINGEKAKESMMLYEKTFSALKCPFYSVLGNHDNPFYFKKMMGPLNYSFDAAPYHFIVLDDISGVGSDHVYGGKFGRQAAQWLEEHLKSVNKKTPIIIFCHAPIFRHEPYAKKQLGTAYDSEEIIKMLKPYNIIAWFAGHAHAVNITQRDGVKYHITGCMSDNRVNSNCRRGYRIIKVYADKIDSRYAQIE